VNEATRRTAPTNHDIVITKPGVFDDLHDCYLFDELGQLK
jgi:hypothetical protein